MPSNWEFGTLALAVLACSAGAFISFAVALKVKNKARMDIPNERSSHTKPTPTGGGLGIALSLILASTLLGIFFTPAFIGLTIGLIILACLGWKDDSSPLSARLRLAAQLVAVLFTISPWLPLLPINPWFWPAIAIALLWLINLYNFMDGTDGIASVQTLLFTLGAFAIQTSTFSTPQGLLLMIMGAATAGFLLLNWPPAKIFMGDVGSTTLGLTIGAYVLFSTESLNALAAMVILLAGFLVDASWTLAQRLVSGQKFWQAHRLHAYQKLTSLKGHHLPVLGLYLGLGVFIQLPLAYYALHSTGLTWILATCAAITVHGIFCYVMRAGRLAPKAERPLKTSHQQ